MLDPASFLHYAEHFNAMEDDNQVNGNARALAAIARLADRPDLARECDEQAATIKRLTQAELWDPQGKFSKVRRDDELGDVRATIGFIPWYFDLPAAGYESAWTQLTDLAGFRAP